MDDPAKNSIWNYLIPLHYLEQVSSILERRGVEVSLTSHFIQKTLQIHHKSIDINAYRSYNIKAVYVTAVFLMQKPLAPVEALA